MEFRVLGPLEVRRDGGALALGGQKQRELLTLLLLRANEPVATERIVDELWGERPPGSAQTAVHGHVSQLRRLLGRERILTRRPGYILCVEPGELDLERFSRLIQNAREQEAAEAAHTLREALSLWRGEPLSDLAYEPFVQTEAARLEELRLTALEARIDAELEVGFAEQLVPELEGLIRAHPLRERLRGQLMLALYRSGRQAEALAAYREARRALVEELGIEPGRPLRELERAILRQDPALEVAPASAEVVEAADGGRGVFVGRDRELEELSSALQSAISGAGSLSLLVGEPGIGKSRLADELMRRARTRGVTVLVGRCWEAGGAPAYWPWVQALRTYIEAGEPEALREQLGIGAADIGQIVPELRERVADLPTPSLEGEGARFRLFDSATRFLRNAAAARPLLLVLDDLHAADEPSLLLLR